MIYDQVSIRSASDTSTALLQDQNSYKDSRPNSMTDALLY